MRREKRPTIEPEAGTKWDKNRVKWEKEWSEVTTCHASRTVIITALSAPTLRSLFVPFAGRYGERMMTGNAGVNRVPEGVTRGSFRSRFARSHASSHCRPKVTRWRATEEMRRDEASSPSTGGTYRILHSNSLYGARREEPKWWKNERRGKRAPKRMKNPLEIYFMRTGLHF